MAIAGQPLLGSRCWEASYTSEYRQSEVVVRKLSVKKAIVSEVKVYGTSAASTADAKAAPFHLGDSGDKMLEKLTPWIHCDHTKLETDDLDPGPEQLDGQAESKELKHWIVGDLAAEPWQNKTYTATAPEEIQCFSWCMRR